MRRRQIYAVYRGETNLADGTASEIAKKLNISPASVRNRATPSYQKRDKGKNQIIIIKLGKENI